MQPLSVPVLQGGGNFFVIPARLMQSLNLPLFKEERRDFFCHPSEVPAALSLPPLQGRAGVGMEFPSSLFTFTLHLPRARFTARLPLRRVRAPEHRLSARAQLL